MSERTSGAPYFRLFAGFAKAGGSPLYERLALAAAEDAEMLAVAAHARKGQPQANILLGAVHALLLSGADDPLAEYYPSCGGARTAGEGDVYALFKSFVEHRRAELMPLIASRVTNTNEVGRSGLVYPAFDLVAKETKGPLRMVEVGPSAGLNLNWHRYGYRYIGASGTPLIERGIGSSLVLATELRGGRAPNLASRIPVVESAVGLELNPFDVSDPAEAQWLRALIWPERTDRMARLDAALAVARVHPPHIVQGDAAKTLPDLIASLPAGPVCVFHTVVTYQMSESAQAVFRDRLAEAAGGRVVFHVSVEWEENHYMLSLARLDGTDADSRRLAVCDPHGTWLEWAKN